MIDGKLKGIEVEGVGEGEVMGVLPGIAREDFDEFSR
jgi:hypothetical protein